LEKLADRNTHTLDARSARIYQMERIVEAAVALVEFWRDQVPLEYCTTRAGPVDRTPWSPP